MSTNPIQRIAELEAQNAALAAENQSLRANGNARVAIDTLIAEAFERHGRLFREDFTGKLAGNITPFIEHTIRRCQEVEEKQAALEDNFKQHEETVSKSADAMASAFKKSRADEEKVWKAHRALMQEDFGRVDGFVNWFRAELEKNGKASQEAVVDCKLAARACHDVARKMDMPVEEIIASLNEIQSGGEIHLKRAANRLSNTYEKLERPVKKFAAGFLVAVIVVMFGLGWMIVKRNELQLDSNMQQLVNYSEQQKTEMKALLDKAMDEAKESQIDREIKVKMWDYMLNSLTPLQRTEVISKYREQVSDAECKRIDGQMISSYEQMGGRRK